jgi:acyl-CoA synthetase (AMP-forming)/AMP-acid ligase II
VVDVDDPSREVPAGAPGELLVRGPQVFAGYWGSDERPVDDDGWFATGDVVVMDADGFFTVVGRTKDVGAPDRSVGGVRCQALLEEGHAAPPDEGLRKSACPDGR